MANRSRSRAKPAVSEHRSTTLVTASIYKSGDRENAREYEEDTFEVHQFVTEPAYVKVAAGVTKSLGKNTFEFLRVDVSVSVPCYVEKIDETYSAVAEHVAGLLNDEIDKYLDAEGV